MTNPIKTVPTITLLLLLYGFSLAQNCDFYYDNFTKQFIVTQLFPPNNASSERKTPKWSLFWEFGDGHYAIQEQEGSELPSIKHEYPRPGTYDVKLYLTPLYARAVPNAPAAVRTINVETYGNPQMAYEYEKGKDVAIETNTNKEAIAKHIIRTAIRARGNSSGHLLFLFNNVENTDDLKFEPFNDTNDPQDGPGLYYGDFLKETVWDIFRQTAGGKLSASDLNFITDQAINEYNSRLIYKMSGQGEFNAFHSLLVDNNLAANLYRTKELKIATAWIPDDGSFSQKKHFIEYDFRVENVHDPNKITVSPNKLYFRKGIAKELTTEVKYKNTARGIVDTVEIRLDISKDLVAEEIDDIVLDTAKCKPKLEVYRPGTFQDTVRTVQWRRENRGDKDRLIFTIRNVGLEKREKGLLVFKIKTHEKRPANTEIDGAIMFTGAEKEIKLSAARPKWRQKGIFLTGGIMLTQSTTLKLEEDFGNGPFESEFNPDLVDQNIYDNFAVQLMLHNAPMSRGKLAWGSGAGYSKRTFRYFLDGNFGEEIELQEANLQGFIGVQLRNLVRANAHLGIHFPLMVNRSRGSFREGELVNGITDEYGWLQDKEDYESASLGFSTGLSLEAGDIHGITGGLRINYLRFPSLYKKDLMPCPTEFCSTDFTFQASAQMTTLELFLKLKLSAFGGRN